LPEQPDATDKREDSPGGIGRPGGGDGCRHGGVQNVEHGEVDQPDGRGQRHPDPGVDPDEICPQLAETIIPPTQTKEATEMDIQPPTPPTPTDRSGDVVALTFLAVMLAGVVLWCVAYPADRAWLTWAIVVALPPGLGVAAWILRHPVRVADFFERGFERYSAPTRAEVSLRRRAAIRPARTPAGPPPRLSEDPRYDPAFFTGMAGRESPTPQGITRLAARAGRRRRGMAFVAIRRRVPSPRRA
jgi:hypothetical protein